MATPIAIRSPSAVGVMPARWLAPAAHTFCDSTLQTASGAGGGAALLATADKSDPKLKIPPGPNSPIGVVWIDLSKEHYGIHGTDEPSRIGRAESNGCIRLTNWDAAELSGLVAPGAPVVIRR